MRVAILNTLMVYSFLFVQYVSAGLSSFTMSEAEIQELSPQLVWAIQPHNPVSVSKETNQIVIQFVWLGSLFLGQNILLFSVCDKKHQDDEYRCTRPIFDAYQVTLAYDRTPTLSVDVVIVGLDVDGEPFVSSGVRRFHYNDNVVSYPRHIRVIDYPPSDAQLRFVILNGSLFVLMVFCCYLLMFLCCVRATKSKYQIVKSVNATRKERKETTELTIKEDVEGAETITVPEAAIFVEPV